MPRPLPAALLLLAAAAATAAEPFDTHGRLRVAKNGTHLEHADGTPLFVLADTCWTGPALSSEADWKDYLADRKKKGFTAVQFNMVSPWRTAPTDAEGRQSYTITDGKLTINEDFYAKRLDARLKAVNDAGLLAVPVLCWAHKKGDAGAELSEEQLTALITFEVERYKDAHALWVLAGDNQYTKDADKWKRVGRAVFGNRPGALVTTHPTGENWPWNGWEGETWLAVLGYQSGHGDAPNVWKWIHSGPPAEYGKRKAWTRPVLNLEPPYEGHNGYQTKKPHSDYNVRRAVYWSLLAAPPAGVTYGGHGVWSWHTKPGKGPTDHESTGVAKPWREALDLPGAAQMGYVRRLFESVPWTELRPAQELIEGQPGDRDPGKFVAVAATPDASAIIAYTPTGGRVPLAQLTTDRRPRVTWFDPRTGETKAGGTDYQTPDDRDWILVIRK